MEFKFDLIEQIAQGPQWVYWWTRVIDASNWLLLPFAIVDVRARWALLAWGVNIILILSLYNAFGYTRILGLSHILVWTPLLVYLFKHRQPLIAESWPGRYLYWLMGVIFVSLLFDYVDVARYLMGAVTFT